MAAVRTKSLRNGSAAKRRRGAGRDPAGLNRLPRLETKISRALIAVEKEIDYRVAAARWDE